MRSPSNAIELVNFPSAFSATLPMPGRYIARKSASRGRGGPKRGSATSSDLIVGATGCDFGIQRQRDLVRRRAVEKPGLGVQADDALDVLARLRERDELDELVGGVSTVLRAPARHRPRPRVVRARRK